jgi:hypothetical protein
MVQKQFNETDARKIVSGEMLGKVKTRDGFEVSIIVWDIDASHRIGGIVHLGDHCDYLRQWLPNGKSDRRNNVTTNYDLVLEVEGGEA